MIDNKQALLKAAKIARINLTETEQHKLVSEIDEVLQVFSRIDKFTGYVGEEKSITEREVREDRVEIRSEDPFSNSKLVEKKKFVAPRLVD